MPEILFYILTFLALILLGSLAYGAFVFAPWVPMRTNDLPRVFALANLKPGEVFYDLGCGNGKTVFYAAKNYQVKAIGLEIGLPLYLTCKIRQFLSHDNRVSFKFKNLFRADLSDADVVYIFGMPKNIRDRLREKLLNELKPGARVISYVFEIEGLTPAIKNHPDESSVPIYLYQF